MKHFQFILTVCVLIFAGAFLAVGNSQAASCCDVAGDANADGGVNIGDAVFLINHIFSGGAAPECADEGDANSDGGINIGDAVYLITYIFKGGDAPTCPAPSGAVFIDEYDDGVTYEAFAGSLLEAVQVSADSMYAGTQGLEILIPGTAPFWSGGAFTDSTARDLTGFNALTFWAKASQAATLDVAGLGNDNTGTSLYQAEVTGLALTTDWQQYIIPVPLPAKLDNERGLFYFAEGEGVEYQIWIDEITFDSVTTITNPRPVIPTSTIDVAVGADITVGNGTVTFAVDGTDMVISAMPGYFTFNSSDELVVSVAGDGTITAVGEGSATLTADLGTVAATGSITVNVTSPDPEPESPAPTPTVNADSVVSIFSGVYTDVTTVTWSTDWDNTSIEEFVIGTDTTQKYFNMVFAGIEFNPTVDASAMTHFHMDVWTPEEATGKLFKVKLVDFGANGVYDGGGDDVEHELSFDDNTMAAESWVGIDVPLASFTNLTTTGHIAQMVLSGDFGTFYIDNIYFYDSGNPTEPLTAAPTPTASTVVSLYSDAYSSATVDTWSAVWDDADVEDFVIGSDSSKKYTNLVYAGVVFEAAPLDASAMTRFHMDVWTPLPTAAPANFKVKLVDFGADGAYGGGDDVDHELTFDETTMNTGEWVSIDVPMSDFTNLVTTGHLAQMVISGTLSTVYVDNIYFYVPTAPEPATSAPTPTDAPGDVISVFSDTYTSTPFDDWSSPYDDADVADFAVGSDSMKQYTNLVFSIAEYTSSGTQDISTMTHVHIDVWTPDATDGSSAFKIKLVDYGADGIWSGPGTDDTEHELTFDQATMSTGTWVSLDIPLANFSGMSNTGHFAQMILSGTYGNIFIDNIYFHK